MTRRRVATLAVAAGLAAAACGDDGDGGGEAAEVAEPGLHHACDAPPTTIALEGFGDQRIGSATFDVVDAVAVREPLDTDEGSTIDAYALVLADFELDRSELGEVGADLTPPPEGTVGVLTVVPPTLAGLAEGDVVDHDARLAYGTSTELDPLALDVTRASGATSAPAFRAHGGVEVLAVDEERLCLSMNVTFTDVRGATVSSVRGAILAPIVDGDVLPTPG